MVQIKHLKDTYGNFYPVTHKDAVVGLEDIQVDMTGYATELWVEDKHYLTELPDLKTINGESVIGVGDINIDLSEYSTKTWVDTLYVKKSREYVDLGLPSGILWATMNIGADSPEDEGEYFAWGEVESKEVYDWTTYKWCNGTYNSLTKYNCNSKEGILDRKTQLDLEDDAASVIWKDGWRIPTRKELSELMNKCTWTRVFTDNSCIGYTVTGPNGNSIFLPVTNNVSLLGGLSASLQGYYWTSTLRSAVNRPDHLYFDASKINVIDINFNYSRDLGFAIRPVKDPIPKLDNTNIRENVINKNDGTYYFTTDTKQIYRNGTSYGGNIIAKSVESIPAEVAPIKLLQDSSLLNFHPVTHVKAVIGLEDMLLVVYKTENELLELIKSSVLKPGLIYCIRGFVANIDGSLGVSNIGHKIDLHVRALSENELATEAKASYNTDGTDSFYEDLGVDVHKWDITISTVNNHLGIVIDTKVSTTEQTSLYHASITSVAHNGVDTLIAAYRCNYVSVSKDGGLTFDIVKLPEGQKEARDILYGLNKFVVFDESGSISISENGYDWLYVDYLVNLNTGLEFYTACFSDTEFFITSNLVLYKTSDFINWLIMEHGVDARYGWYTPGLAVGDGKIVVTGGGAMLTKFGVYDGTQWIHTYPFDTYWNGVGFGNHTFAITAGNARSAVINNTDGELDLSWADGTHKYYSDGLNKDPGKVCFHKGVFYSFDIARDVLFYAYSTDGLNWTSINLPKAAYIGSYSQSLPAFGPNDEMYIIDVESNRIWVNETPLDGTTWRILNPTMIDMYKSTALSNNSEIICPKDTTSYYLAHDQINYNYHRFPNNYESPGVVCANFVYKTILYDRPNQLSYFAESTDGVTWELKLLENLPDKYCTNISIDSTENIILCVFEDGSACSIINDTLYPIITESTYYDTKLIYDKYTNSFLYSGASAIDEHRVRYATNTISQITVNLDGTYRINTIPLSVEIIVTCLVMRNELLYISGQEKAKNTGTNLIIDLSNYKEISNFTTEKYATVALCEYSKILMNHAPNPYKNNTIASVIQGTNFIDADFNIGCILPLRGLDKLIAQDDSIVKLGRIYFNTNIQITNLIDEFNNSCRFDFKNIVRMEDSKPVYLFNHNNSDFSLTGCVKNFSQNILEDDLILKTNFNINNLLYNSCIDNYCLGALHLPYGGKHLTFKTVYNDCDFSYFNSALLSDSNKYILTLSNKTMLVDVIENIKYETSDFGINWEVKTTGNKNMELQQ